MQARGQSLDYFRRTAVLDSGLSWHARELSNTSGWQNGLDRVDPSTISLTAVKIGVAATKSTHDGGIHGNFCNWSVES